MKALLTTACSVATLATFTLPASADDSDGYVPPHVVDYEGGALPENAHLEDRTNMKIIGPGIAMAAVPYSLSVLYALSTCGAQTNCRQGSQWLYLPLVGPFITAEQAPTTGGQALSVFDGAIQIVGLGIAAAGVVMPRKVVVWQDKQTAIRVAPAALAGGAGLSLIVTTM